MPRTIRLAADFIADVPLAESHTPFGSVLTCTVCGQQMGPVRGQEDADFWMMRHRVQTHYADPERKQRPPLKLPVQDDRPRCTTPDCKRPAISAGKCWGHISIASGTQARFCLAPGCKRTSHTRGYCTAHYTRLLKTGDVQANVPIGPGRHRSERQCSVEGCGRPHQAKGLCLRHYQRTREARPLVGVCSVEGCGAGAYRRGWCHGHYGRWKLTGDVQADKPIARRK